MVEAVNEDILNDCSFFNDTNQESEESSQQSEYQVAPAPAPPVQAALPLLSNKLIDKARALGIPAQVSERSAYQP